MSHRYCRNRDLGRVDPRQHPNAYLCAVCGTLWQLEWKNVQVFGPPPLGLPQMRPMLIRMTQQKPGGLAFIVEGERTVPR